MRSYAASQRAALRGRSLVQLQPWPALTALLQVVGFEDIAELRRGSDEWPHPHFTQARKCAALLVSFDASRREQER